MTLSILSIFPSRFKIYGKVFSLWGKILLQTHFNSEARFKSFQDKVKGEERFLLNQSVNKIVKSNFQKIWLCSNKTCRNRDHFHFKEEKAA